MPLIADIQAYLKHSAQQQYKCVPIPGFLACFHPTSDFSFFNYAIPDIVPPEIWHASLPLLETLFRARGRTPRFEFVEECAPALPQCLQEAGWVEEERQIGMVCTTETFRPAPEIPGLMIRELTPESPLPDMQIFFETQARGFDPEAIPEPKTNQEVQHFRNTLGQGAAYLAILEKRVVGVGMYTSPFQGITEITSVATVEAYRQRGIASALMTTAIHNALAREAHTIYLTAADARAGRVYERLGFRACLTMLAYVQPQS